MSPPLFLIEGLMFKYAIIAILFLLFGLPAVSFGQQTETMGLWSLGIANDSFFNQDRGYSSGLDLAFTPNNRGYTLSVGQDIFTPETRDTLQPPPGEHPYAAWLYVKGEYRYNVLSTLLVTSSLSFGTTGRKAQGKEVQDFAHQVLDFNEYSGWDSQISQRWGWIASAKGEWLFPLFESGKTGLDLTPFIQGQVGNVYVNGEAGATVRWGYQLPQLQAKKRASSLSSLYVTVTGSRKIVDKNIMLEGVSAQDYHVAPERGVNTLICGVHWLQGAYQVDLDFHFPEKEFKGQSYTNQYGVLRLSYWY
jgi:hypothetical protein